MLALIATAAILLLFAWPKLRQNRADKSAVAVSTRPKPATASWAAFVVAQRRLRRGLHD